MRKGWFISVLCSLAPLPLRHLAVRPLNPRDLRVLFPPTSSYGDRAVTIAVAIARRLASLDRAYKLSIGGLAVS